MNIIQFVLLSFLWSFAYGEDSPFNISDDKSLPSYMLRGKKRHSLSWNFEFLPFIFGFYCKVHLMLLSLLIKLYQRREEPSRLHSFSSMSSDNIYNQWKWNRQKSTWYSYKPPFGEIPDLRQDNSYFLYGRLKNTDIRECPLGYGLEYVLHAWTEV